MSLKHNIGKTDKWIRVIAGIAIMGVGYYLMSWVWGIVGVIIFATGIIDWCLFYRIFGISTCKTKAIEKNVENSSGEEMK